MLRAGVVTTLVAGGLITFTAPAMAAPPTVSVSPGQASVQAGNNVSVTANVTTDAPGQTSVTISVSGLPSGVTCNAGCGEHQINGTDAITLTLRAAGNAPVVNGADVTVQAKIDAEQGTGSFKLSVTAPPPPPPTNVKDITVRVTDVSTGSPIQGMDVVVTDSANHTWTGSTTAIGQFKVTSTTQKPIAVGEISVIAGNQTYEQSIKSMDGRAGQSVVFELRLQLKAGAVPPSADPSAAVPTDTASAEATDLATEETETDAGALDETSGEESGGMSSWILIVLGGLLVALGVGAIVLLLLRRRDDSDEDEAVEPGYGPRGPGPHPQGRPGYGPGPQPMGGRPADRTMVTRNPMADAPTMMHRVQPPAPRPPQPGYGQPQTYAAGPAYPTSPSPAGYGSPAYPSSPAGSGYGGEPGYPSVPQARGGEYGGRGNDYAPQEYGDRGGYDNGGYGMAEPRGYDEGYGHVTQPYGQSAGYEPRYDQQNPYESGAQPRSYGQPGYDPDGYDARGGYEGNGYDNRVPGQRGGGGYEANYDDGYYEEPAGRRSAQGRGDQRRSLDWLDD